MDWLTVGIIAAVVAALVFGYPLLNKKLSLETKYPQLGANLPRILEAIDYLIAIYYPKLPYLALIKIVKDIIKMYFDDSNLNPAEMQRILDYVLTDKFSAKRMMEKPPQVIPTETKSEVDNIVEKVVGFGKLLM